MRLSPLVLAVGLGLLSGCHDKTPPAQAAADTTKAADTVTTATTVGTVPRAKPAPAPVARRENLVKVTEATPGLLAQAKILPIDAQHLAETVYPEATVKGATIDRRAGNLVYSFEVQRKDVAGTELVLVNAADGSIVNTIHRDKVVAENPTKPKHKP